jgi:hypothetical protein
MVDPAVELLMMLDTVTSSAGGPTGEANGHQLPVLPESLMNE